MVRLFTIPLLNWNVWMWYRKVEGEEEYVASLLLWCCHSYVVSPIACLGNGQEINVTAEVLPSSPKLLPGEVGGWVTGSCTNLLPYSNSVLLLFIQGSGISCWGEKERPWAGNSYYVTRLQLCELWAYLINQLVKTKIRQRLETSGQAEELIQLPRWQPLLCSRAHYSKNFFVLLRIELVYLIPLKHSPCLSPLPWCLAWN